ncbi:Ankyrin repeat-containing domain [Pseudocohnilembus persalinus]|uniref:Ankyrin repeat-containing domain n=1 Tax=Pseudocohnilembus persalinus TaxID=266149 RepID=A0A0V0QG25_PSEPJ|nr:Ankyrin repeat-containing domain [Pseudocohnilembus persalinus]|eukprot:KRX01166.1 Ankyrin repeat-containing domain [Pseudocohnilembus persalinus]
MIYLAQYGNLQMLQKLEQKDLDINYQDYEGKTALHYASKLGQNQYINLLILNGAIISIKDYALQQTPVQMAYNFETRQQMIVSSSKHVQNPNKLLKNDKKKMVSSSHLKAISKRDTEIAKSYFKEIGDSQFSPKQQDSNKNFQIRQINPLPKSQLFQQFNNQNNFENSQQFTGNSSQLNSNINQNPYQNLNQSEFFQKSLLTTKSEVQESILYNKSKMQFNSQISQKLPISSQLFDKKYNNMSENIEINRDIIQNFDKGYHSYLQNRFIKIMKQIQIEGIDNWWHLNQPWIYTSSWMEGVETADELYQKSQSIPSYTIMLIVFNLLMPVNIDLPTQEQNQNEIQFPNQQWFTQLSKEQLLILKQKQSNIIKQNEKFLDENQNLKDSIIYLNDDKKIKDKQLQQLNEERDALLKQIDEYKIRIGRITEENNQKDKKLLEQEYQIGQNSC